MNNKNLLKELTWVIIFVLAIVARIYYWISKSETEPVFDFTFIFDFAVLLMFVAYISIKTKKIYMYVKQRKKEKND